ncbi:CYFA0S10e04577g1_1 [Cyberlindnera fabianii]|uniref:CYFA0S10e04577g1_1 n=1 Tax=Cyberlindnera fabianii TaxID=36022 RepID=A0A061B7W5_CYBFA|nr:CYFA0S10e04577g1_1 [Cyberlindnera fabianii]
MDRGEESEGNSNEEKLLELMMEYLQESPSSCQQDAFDLQPPGNSGKTDLPLSVGESFGFDVGGSHLLNDPPYCSSMNSLISSKRPPYDGMCLKKVWINLNTFKISLLRAEEQIVIADDPYGSPVPRNMVRSGHHCDPFVANEYQWIPWPTMSEEMWEQLMTEIGGQRSLKKARMEDSEVQNTLLIAQRLKKVTQQQFIEWKINIIAKLVGRDAVFNTEKYYEMHQYVLPAIMEHQQGDKFRFSLLLETWDGIAPPLHQVAGTLLGTADDSRVARFQKFTESLSRLKHIKCFNTDDTLSRSKYHVVHSFVNTGKRVNQNTLFYLRRALRRLFVILCVADILPSDAATLQKIDDNADMSQVHESLGSLEEVLMKLENIDIPYNRFGTVIMALWDVWKDNEVEVGDDGEKLRDMIQKFRKNQGDNIHFKVYPRAGK